MLNFEVMEAAQGRGFGLLKGTGEGRAAGRVAGVVINRHDREVTHILLSQRSSRRPGLERVRPGKPALLYFTTPQCAPCKTVQRPVIEQIRQWNGDALEADDQHLPQRAHILVGGALDADKAAEVISQLEPRIVIPMHYQTEFCTLKLDSLTKFLKEMGMAEHAPEDSLKVTKATLPEETQVVVLTCKQG